ncbi:hypothetical protein NPIL_62461 [Nephila pilipes]|uniref:Uncharacterized protein n=1 Tax=Nephila pilipes TaxID=299642 RepID=A0A8X6MWA0_NEPPI|nr:hypothetical protein NPIL_62461 [Nephila pilipes]
MNLPYKIQFRFLIGYAQAWKIKTVSDNDGPRRSEIIPKLFPNEMIFRHHYVDDLFNRVIFSSESDFGCDVFQCTPLLKRLTRNVPDISRGGASVNVESASFRESVSHYIASCLSA